MTVEQIIKELGGVSFVKKELKIKYNSLIYGWIYRGVIPSWRKEALIELAIKLNKQNIVKELKE